MAGWYELRKRANGEFDFVLKAGNGEIILQSEGYAAKASALNGIASVQTNSPLEERYERRESKSAQPYFVLLAKNHQVIGQSEMYSSVAARDNGIGSVQRNGSTATIKDLTVE